MIDASYLIEALGLEPHPEGGFYKETYRAEESLPSDVLPDRYDGSRACSTCIYFLLTKDSFSGLHKIVSDEIFHFYMGDPVTLFTISKDGEGKEVELGTRIDRGERPQVIVPKETWQGAKIKTGFKWALLGCTVAPGFDFADFEMADSKALRERFPNLESQINNYIKVD